MKEVIEYQHHRIVALDKRIAELKLMILEVCDKECPDDYRRIIKEEILNE